MPYRVALFVFLAIACSDRALAQDGIAYRTSQGTLIGTSSDGTLRYREDTGWNSTSFTNAKWGISYANSHSAAPWAVVLQADRTNAAVTANANQLTFDLNGKTYSVRPYLASGSVVKGGQVTIVESLSASSYLRVQNGTFDNAFGTNSKTLIGDGGVAGRLYVEDGLFRAYTAYVSGAANTPSLLVLDSHGTFSASNALYLGTSGNGSVQLAGSGSELTAGYMRLGSATTTGSIVVNEASSRVQVTKSGDTAGDLMIGNSAPLQAGQNVGLRINAGRVDVQGNLRLGMGSAGPYGAAEINGGTLSVLGNISLNSSSSETSGGKLYLNEGRVEVASPTAFAPALQRQFYWKEGTVAFTGTSTDISETQLKNLTQQGALSYGGNRAAGVLATGQTLEAAGTMNLQNGSVGLAGGSIRAGNGLNLNASMTGFGTLDAVLQGEGGITNNTSSAISIGALNGANAIVSAGDVLVGSRNVDATFTGSSSGSGTFIKTGTGTQGVTGAITNSGGVRVEAGSLHFDHAGFQTTDVTIRDGGRLHVSGGTNSTAASLLINASQSGTTAGQLQILGSESGLSISGDVQNGGWIELVDGSLNVAGVLNNNGVISNNGILDGVINGTGTVTGAGTFSGPVTIEAGAMLAPGNSPGTALFSDLTLGAGGMMEFEIANADGVAGVDWDVAVVSNLLSLTATAANPFTIVLKSLGGDFELGALTNFNPERNYSWKFVSANIDSPTGFDLSAIKIAAEGFNDLNSEPAGIFNAGAANDGLYLVYSASPASAPEPNSLILLTLAGGLWGARRLRRSFRTRYCERTTAA